MDRRCLCIGILFGGILLEGILLMLLLTRKSTLDYDRDFCRPLVIAHRGASGYVPEHTLRSYALAATMGADYIEPDVVITKDGHIIARHDNELGLTTDVAQRPEFASRYRIQSVDGHVERGWFTEDFTLAEIKSLNAIERMPFIRPGNARMTGFKIPTIQEIIDLVKRLEDSLHRPIGIYLEFKHATHFQRLGLAMEKALIDILHNSGYRGPEAHIYIQSFEVSNLKELKTLTKLRLSQLLSANATRQPFDQSELNTSLTYGQMATPEGLLEIATYAYAVGPDKSYIIPRNAGNKLGDPTSFVSDAHTAGLRIHPYNFRSENLFLPAEYRSSDDPAAIGDAEGELRAFLATGVDGLFVDHPNDMVHVRDTCN